MPTKEEYARRRKLWTDALRSGGFKQARWVLHTPRVSHEEESPGYCCLGVACVVAMGDGVPLSVGNSPGLITYDGHRSDLPESVRTWLGLTTTTGAMGHLGSLTKMNDNMDAFEIIADVIDRAPFGLFIPDAA